MSSASVLTQAAYLAQAKALHPRGLAHVIAVGSTREKLWEAIAKVYGDVDARAGDVDLEIDPRTASELLADWERVFGLPGPCAPLAKSVNGRRGALWAKITAQGGQTPAYLVEVALAAGYVVTIEEHFRFVVGRGRVGPGGTSTVAGKEWTFPRGRLWGDVPPTEDWAFNFTVHAPEQTAFYFRVGESAVGDRLVEWGNDRLECVIEDVKPAHTRAQFAYDQPFDGFSPWPDVYPSAPAFEFVAPTVQAVTDYPGS